MELGGGWCMERGSLQSRCTRLLTAFWTWLLHDQVAVVAVKLDPRWKRGQHSDHVSP